MYPISRTEHLVETKTCRQCNTFFPITDKDMEFYEKVSPVFGGKKYTIPPPTLCPDCRQQRRLSFRNERKLYKRTCDATGKEIISIYSPDKSYIVYHQDYWWSDAWDPMEYGREIDFKRSFFGQFSELLEKVPRSSLFNKQSENSEYTQTCTNNKNCYMLFESSFDEDCLFGYWIHHSSFCLDCSYCDYSENCYDCLDCSESFKLIGSQDCHNCRESYYLKSCTGCESCFGSENLVNAQYVFLGKQLSKEEYEKQLEFLAGKRYGNKPHFSGVKRATQIHESEHCTGDYIRNAKNCHSCFYVFDGAEDTKYMCNTGIGAKDVMDGDAVGANATLVYESINTALDSHETLFSVRAWGCSGCVFVNECDSCHDCFGCVGLRNASYCILNKQYTKEEYEILVPKIIEKMMATPLRQGFEGQVEWGEFFPASLSPFGYNETVANEYYPMIREEVLGLDSSPKIGEVGRGVGNLGIGESPRDTITHPLNPPHGGGEGNRIADDASNRDSFLKGTIGSEAEDGGFTGLELGKSPASFHSAPSFKRGLNFNWSDYESPFPKVEKIIKASLLPEDITQIPDDILNWAIECEVTGKPFRIIRQELEFYRKHNLPIPRRHPDQRHLDRMKQRNPRKLFERNCDCCKKPMITTYSPERPETVYCGACYEKEVIG